MTIDFNMMIRVMLYILLVLSFLTLVFVGVLFLRRIKHERKLATTKTITGWLAGITTVGTFCIAALNVKVPIGILPEADPAFKAIETYYQLIQERQCEKAWELIHPARQEYLKKEYRGF